MMLKIQLWITGINYILKYTQIENSYFKLMFLNIILNNISQYYFYYCIFDQINAVLVSRRDFQKHDKIKHLNSMYFHIC